MFSKTREWLAIVFEFNRCRFRKECEYYLEDNPICNKLTKRFPDMGSADCAYYRALEENKEERK